MNLKSNFVNGGCVYFSKKLKQTLRMQKSTLYRTICNISATKNSEDTRNTQISVELVKEILKYLFKEQEKAWLNILLFCKSVMNQRLVKWVTEIQNNNPRLDDLNKVADDLKLSIEASQDVWGQNKISGRKSTERKGWQQRSLDDLWDENENLQEKLRDLEERLQRDNTSVVGLEELKKDSWE